ncbi:uncharacterized protein LOC125549403 [Triticum urartu]|uniref:uncharacterized protein LOC125549403 n=1 Tax=Triticum urartu TaxID=4572 RepID=UPI0020449A6C|nr:uncharacterized protein LOC125549403 [Triticum urartu]
MMLVSGPRVAVSGLRRADCRAVPALMKMNVSCSSMPVGISGKNCKGSRRQCAPERDAQYSILLCPAQCTAQGPCSLPCYSEETREEIAGSGNGGQHHLQDKSGAPLRLFKVSHALLLLWLN